VSFPEYVLSRIKSRATRLRILSGIHGEMIGRAEAERIAAKQIAQEERARPKPPQHAAPGDEITVANAREYLIRMVTTVGQRMRDAALAPRAAPVAREASAAPVVTPRASRFQINKPPLPDPEPASVIARYLTGRGLT
jgi:hypothetical protein